LNRRQFLAGSLTLAGLGALGCRGAQAPAPGLQGQRRDPSYQQGHRLRGRDLPSQPVRQERCQAVILGGGVSGLSAAWRWRHAGLDDFLLLELEPSLGGNSRCLQYPVSKAPIGAHYLPVPNREARAVRRLLTEMDVLRSGPAGPELDGLQLCHSPQERVHYMGHWYSGLLSEELLDSEAAEQLHHFQEHIHQWQQKRDADGRKVFALPMAWSSPDPRYQALDRISFADYADQQGWTSPLLRWYLEYGCRDDFGGALDNCSAWAGLHYFAARDGGGLGDPGDILVWPEGNHRLVEFLAGRARNRCRAGCLVVSVRPTDRGVTVDYLEVATQQRVRVSAEVAVYCLPTFTRPYLIEGEKPRESFVYPPWVTANLCLSRTPEDSQGAGMVAWDNVLYGSPSLGYVVATHQEMAFDPLRPTVWTWYRPFVKEDPKSQREKLLQADWGEWSQTVLSDLELAHPDIRQVCHRLDITVLGHGMIRPSVGFLSGDQIATARQPRHRLFFGHGDLSGMSLFEESQYRGVLAAEAALAVLGSPPQTSFLET
jgi:glycine/D-amino acid oxidase-like deaminating enzyme